MKLGLFDVKAHNPSFFAVREEVGQQGEILDFCVPVNPYFPPPELLDRIRDNLTDILKYYPDQGRVHEDALASFTGVPAENIVAANGSTELITLLCRSAEGPMMTTVPTFGRWTDLPVDFGKEIIFLQRQREDGFRLDAQRVIERARETCVRTVVICNPDNPTGAHFTSADIRRLASDLADLAMIIIDESFIDFADLESAATLAVSSRNLVVVKSLGKSVGWHGIRLGYAVASAERARALRLETPYWNINGLASFVLKALPEFRERYAASFTQAALDRQYMAMRLEQIPGLTVYPSQANFLYCELPAGVSGRTLRDRLLEYNGLMIRECSNKIGSSESFLRLAVQKRAAVDRLAAALAAHLGDRQGG